MWENCLILVEGRPALCSQYDVLLGRQKQVGILLLGGQAWLSQWLIFFFFLIADLSPATVFVFLGLEQARITFIHYSIHSLIVGSLFSFGIMFRSWPHKGSLGSEKIGIISQFSYFPWWREHNLPKVFCCVCMCMHVWNQLLALNSTAWGLKKITDPFLDSP